MQELKGIWPVKDTMHQKEFNKVNTMQAPHTCCRHICDSKKVLFRILVIHYSSTSSTDAGLGADSFKSV